MATVQSTSSTKSLSGWDVSAFQNKVDCGQLYEAHQIVKAAAQRHFQANHVETACKLLNSAIRIFLKAETCEAEAADLLEVARGYLDKSRPDAANQSETAWVLPLEKANAELSKLSDLHALWLPRTPELAKRKLLSMRDMIQLSSRFNSGRADARIHMEAGHACYALREFKGAVDNFTAGGDPEATALALEEWVTTAQVPPTEIDLLVTRAICLFMLFRDTEAALVLRERCSASSVTGSSFRSSPLHNFTKFLAVALQSCLISEVTRDDGLAVVTMLEEHYAPILVKRDREFKTYYFAHLKKIYFNIEPPKPPQPKGHMGGMDMGKMMQMASTMMQQNPDMVRNIQQMMGVRR